MYTPFREVINYDPHIDALDIGLIEGKIEWEVINLSDQVAIDIGPGGKVVATKDF